MIRRVMVRSFKSVSDGVNLQLAPLTILAGANSSGKSTLLQTILLTTQTLSSKVTSRPLVLNGPTVRLGAFDDVLSLHAPKSRSFTIGFEIGPFVEGIDAHAARFDAPLTSPEGRRLGLQSA